MMSGKELLEKLSPQEGSVITADPQVRAARFSPCGKILAAGGFDARLRRWNVSAEGTPEMPALEGHHGWVDPVAFRAAGELLFSGDSWGQLCCWANYAAEQPGAEWRHEQAHDGWLRDVAVARDGALLATCGSDKIARVWSADDGGKRHELAGYGQDLLRVCFAPDDTLLTGDDRGLVKHWRLDGSLIREFDASSLYALSRLQDVGGVHALALNADGTTLAVGGTAPKNGGTVVGIPTVLLFDLASGEQRHKLELGTPNDCYVADIAFREEGFLSIVTYGTPGQGQLLFTLPGEPAPFFDYKKMANCQSLSWHPDGKRLAVVATNPGSNGNGRPLDQNGNYVGNKSPIHLFSVSSPTPG